MHIIVSHDCDSQIHKVACMFVWHRLCLRRRQWAQWCSGHGRCGHLLCALLSTPPNKNEWMNEKDSNFCSAMKFKKIYFTVKHTGWPMNNSCTTTSWVDQFLKWILQRLNHLSYPLPTGSPILPPKLVARRNVVFSDGTIESARCLQWV